MFVFMLHEHENIHGYGHGHRHTGMCTQAPAKSEQFNPTFDIMSSLKPKVLSPVSFVTDTEESARL